jgi:hypothetical protein
VAVAQLETLGGITFMTLLSFLNSADFVVSILVNVVVLCFAFPTYRRAQLRAFALLIWASVLGIVLEAGTRFHPVSFDTSVVSFWQLYRVGFMVYDLLWCIALVQLMQHVLKGSSEKTGEALANIGPAKQFKTRLGLWLLLSLILFIPPWFFMDIAAGGDSVKHPIQLLALLISNPTHVAGVDSRVFWFVLFFAVPALAIGWVVQSLVVMIRDRIRSRKRRAA